MKKAYTAVVPASGWSDKITFSPAVRAGNLLFISGTVAGLIRPGALIEVKAVAVLDTPPG